MKLNAIQNKEMQGYISMMCILLCILHVHVHFVAPNPTGIENKVTTNDDKSTARSLTDSSIGSQDLIKSFYQIGDFAVVKYDNSWRYHCSIR